jgi:hypothetical protein
MRPPESRSIVATCFASSAGGRSEIGVTAVPSRICSVLPAM